MKYLSIDIETTGLDYTENQMIEFGCVIDDTEHPEIPVEELPRRRILYPRKNYNINPFCMRMHEKLFKTLESVDWNKLNEYGYYKEKDFYFSELIDFDVVFGYWVEQQLGKGPYLVAGKNFFGFDYRFLEPHLNGIKFRHRAIDPAMFFMRPTDETPPGMKTCCERAGIPLVDYHTSIGDAETVIRLVRCGLAA
jgi:hypothetical protein